MKVDFFNENGFGLIGYPLGHSMSGIIHNELLKSAA